MKQRTRKTLVVVCLIFLSTLTSAYGQTIKIHSVPPFKSSGLMTGSVGGVAYPQYKISAWIKPQGIGWWPKPFFANLDVPIDPTDGTFSVNVVTGGLDSRATLLCAVLLPVEVAIPQTGNLRRIPKTLVDQALAIDCVERHGRTLNFAGLSWAVKDAPLPVGPGGNRFSDSEDNVFVDEAGALHLKVSFANGQWWSAEVNLLNSLGYGTYLFRTSHVVDDVDPNATFGMFLWDDHGDGEHYPFRGTAADNREIDFEHGRWGAPFDVDNAQAVVQPFNVLGNLVRYYIPPIAEPGSPTVTQWFTWQPGQVEFLTIHGAHPTCQYPEEALINWTIYNENPSVNHFVPDDGRETVRLNLWLNQSGLSAGDTAEVVISDFRFIPLDEDGDGVLNHLDVCYAHFDPAQNDRDGDGIGDRCDTDYNQNGITDPFDLTHVKSCFGPVTPNCEDADHNQNGVVDPFDLSLLKARFGRAGGPSCIAPEES